MRQKKCKKIRKNLGYDMKKEREEKRKYFSLLHKTLKDENGNSKNCGLISSEERRLYQLTKKFS